MSSRKREILSVEVPSNEGMEDVVLGALLQSKDAMPIVASTLKPEYFYNQGNMLLYSVLLKMFLSDKPIDIMTVMDESIKSGDYERIGGKDRLVELTSRVGSSANIEAHARVIVEHWMLRHMLSCAEWLVGEVKAGADAFDVMDGFEMKFSELSRAIGMDVKPIGKVISDLIESAKKAHDSGGKMIGENMTGIDKFEELHGGGMSGDLIVITGDSGSGKSSMFNNMLCQFSVMEEPIYAWSGELNDEDMAARMLAAFTDTSSYSIKGGEFYRDVASLRSMEEATEMLRNKKVFLDYSAMSLAKMKSTIINKYRVDGVRTFLFDRLELFDLSSIDRNDDVAKARLMQTLRGLANQLKIKIVVAAQLRKEFESRPLKIPRKHDILGSAAIYQSATKVVIIYRPEIYDYETFQDGTPTKGMAEIYVDKNTHGSIGVVRVEFNAIATTFGDGFYGREDDIPSPKSEPFVPQKVSTVPSKTNDDEDSPF